MCDIAICIYAYINHKITKKSVGLFSKKIIKNQLLK